MLELVWRGLNFSLALSALIWLLADLRLNYIKLSPRRIYLTLSLAGLLFAVVTGSIENILQHNPIGIRTAITTASCVWCLIGLWVSRKE